MFAREIIYTPYFYLQKRNHVGSINEFSSNTRLSLIDRFATTEAEIEEKRLKLNAERTIKQNKAAENDVTAFLVALSSYKSCIVDSLCEVNDEL